MLSIGVLLAVVIGFGSAALAAPPHKSNPANKHKTTTTTTVPTTTTVADTTSTTAPPVTASTIGPWRGVYAPHGWVAVPRPIDEVQASVAAVRDAGFNAQILNLGYLDETGTIPSSVHPALSTWVATTRSIDPSMKVLGWINGSEAAHVDDTALHRSTATWLADLVATHGLDGVVLDLEPFGRDNPSYEALLKTIRAASPETWIGVNGPADGQWSSSFISRISVPVDGLVPMHYDTSLSTAALYSARVASEHSRYVAAAGAAATILPALPAYGPNAWHDPAVENIETAVAGIAASSPGLAEGAAVYNWHELDATSLRQWQLATG